MARKATGHVEVRSLNGGDYYYAKLKLPDGTQARRALGKVWAKRSAPRAGFLTRAQAEARLAAILDGTDAVRVKLEPTRATFGQACEERVRYLRTEKARKPSTLRDYRSVIDSALIPFFGSGTPLEDITVERVEELRERLLAEKSHRTAQKILVVLHGVMDRARRKCWIDTNPCDLAERVTLKRSDEVNVLSVDQVHAVAVQAGGLMGNLIIVAAFTGLRLGELQALRWRNIDFTARSLRVERNLVRGEVAADGYRDGSPKSHRSRSVPLADQAVVALDAVSRREAYTGPDDRVFTITGGALSGDVVRDTFYAALGATGLGHLREKDEPIVFHDLRHTFGTLSAAAGVDVVRLQKWMGHADIQTTMRYLHYAPKHDDAARLTAAFGPGSVAPSVAPNGGLSVQLSATESA